MNFETCLSLGNAKKTEKDVLRAKSLIKSSRQAIQTAKIIPFQETTLKTIFRELYEGLREYCEALGFICGYKFSDHESITYFLSDILKEKEISEKFDRYRKIRNGINYYGNEINKETIGDTFKEIPKMLSALKKYE